MRKTSFSGNTEVATPDGEEEIEDIEVGDEVLAWDEETGRTGVYRVTDTMVHEDPVVVYLELDGEEITTTPEHPFYTRERGWVEAGELRLGEHVRRLDGGYGEVRSMRSVQHQQQMYNLTVETAHTFYVGDGDWLVHNSSRKLGCNLGSAPMSGAEAHHIIAENSKRVSPARAILSKVGIKVDDAENGVWLQGPGGKQRPGHPNAHAHRPIHTKVYYAEVNVRLAGARTKAQAVAILKTIEREILLGRFPR